MGPSCCHCCPGRQGEGNGPGVVDDGIPLDESVLPPVLGSFCWCCRRKDVMVVVVRVVLLSLQLRGILELVSDRCQVFY